MIARIIYAIIVLIWACSCSPYLPFVSTLSTKKENCEELKSFVATHWFKHKEKKLYKYKDKDEFINKINTSFKPCFFNLSFEEVKELFGEPNLEIANDELNYHVSEGCLQEYIPCELLVISFDNSELTPVWIAIQ